MARSNPQPTVILNGVRVVPSDDAEEWIPTSVALPVVGAPPYYPASERVLFAVDGEARARVGQLVILPAAQWWADNDVEIRVESVTHWRPLPAPPPR